MVTKRRLETPRSGTPKQWYQGLQADVDRIGELKAINGADWDVEIGTITEMGHHRGERSHALLFDNIKGYPKGYRVVSNTMNTTKRLALTLHQGTNYTRIEFVKEIKNRITNIKYIPPEYVEDGPILENVLKGDDIDMWKFPTPKWHELDGGRYIGTGSIDITADPDTGWVNLGTYRVMIHDRDTLGFYISPGKQGRIMREKYFAKGQPCKVAVSFGQDPLIYLAGGTEVPNGVSEYDWVGGLQGGPVQVIKGEYTGLPIPAHAEIVVEAEALPGQDRNEGPFGEWTGYYASDVRPEPIMKVKRLYHRNDPILLGAPPTRPPCEFNYMRCFVRSAMIWRELEAAGVPDVTGVWCHEAGGARLFVFVSIKQRYPGHARQAGMVASYCRAGAYLGRYSIVVDDDVDVTNTNDVLWALATRSNPETDIEIVRRSWSGPLDPIVPKGQKGHNSRAIIDACRPYEWMADFPPVAESSPEVRRAAEAKWGKILDE
ncbi:MAG: UbiD family decarboxylase [Acidobacteria bacterium]|nr:MAG: UbiD family decarboxylase [Acidobacteriota bacterium]